MIYAEAVFIDNFIMDMLLLCIAARSSAVHTRFWRLAAGAAAGGAYAVGCAALPILAFPPVILAVSAVMCVIMTGFSLRLFFDVLVRLWAFSLLLGGGVYAASVLFGTVTSGETAVIRYLLIGCSAAVVASEYLMRRTFRPAESVTVEAVFSGRSVVFSAAYDSGAAIRDSSGGGVIIADSSVFGDMPLNVRGHKKQRRFRIQTAGGYAELFGIMPDRLILTAGGTRYIARAYILLSDGVSLDGCPALIGRGIRAIKTTGERQRCEKDSVNF